MSHCIFCNNLRYHNLSCHNFDFVSINQLKTMLFVDQPRLYRVGLLLPCYFLSRLLDSTRYHEMPKARGTNVNNKIFCGKKSTWMSTRLLGARGGQLLECEHCHTPVPPQEERTRCQVQKKIWIRRSLDQWQLQLNIINKLVYILLKKIVISCLFRHIRLTLSLIVEVGIGHRRNPSCLLRI